MMIARFFAALMMQPTLLSVMGLSARVPGKSHEVGLYASRYWVSVPRATFERTV